MKTIDFILSYLREEATYEEKVMIRKEFFPNYTPPPINPEAVMQSLINNCHRKWIESGRKEKLMVVKYIKDVTGWGLKEAKDWGDATIFIN